MDDSKIIAPFDTPPARPVYVMAKPVGPMCNLNCKYCYYTPKQKMFEAHKTFMSDEVLETFIRQYIAAQPGPDVQFTWHGGEATIRNLAFYRRVIELQEKYGAGRRIQNCLQTNGMLLNAAWCRFLKDYNWLVGISVDGPAHLHDNYRRSVDGRPTHMRVMQSIQMLRRHGVDWNAMAVVHNENVEHPQEFYQFFKDNGCQYIQFTPIVEVDKHGHMTAESVTPEQWGRFLNGIFDQWVRSDVGRVYVQIFDATLCNYVGVDPGLCTLSATCGHAAALEHNGDLYSCDHFVFPEHRLGNIRTNTISRMMSSEQQQQFATMKVQNLSAKCKLCKWLALCYGECPKNRLKLAGKDQQADVNYVKEVVTPDTPNYLCAGYQAFFEHTAPAFQFMANEYRAGRAPANVMKLYN